MSSLYLDYGGPVKIKKEKGIKCSHSRKYFQTFCIRCYAKTIGATVRKAEPWNKMAVADLR